MGKSVFETFEQTVENAGDKTALIFLGEKYSYRFLKEASERLATAFVNLGIKKGDKFIIYTQNCPQWMVTWLGLQRIGAVPVPVSPIYTIHDLEYIASDSGAVGMLSADTNFGYAKKLKEKGILDTLIVSNVGDMLPWWKRAIGKGFDRIPDGKVEEENIIRFRTLLKTPPDDSARVDCDSDEIMEILYTGGTTKFPKGVHINHTVYMQSFVAQLKISESLVPLGQNVIVQGAQLFHVLGQLFGLGPICLTGATVIIMPRVNLDALMLYVQRYDAKTLFGVPTLYRMILEHDRRDFYDLSSLRYCFTGGDVLPQEVLRRWKDHFGTRIFQGYGATETCGGVTMVRVTGDPPLDSIGTLMPEKEIRIADPETLEAVPSGGTGELIVTSENMIEAYWNKEEETQECFVEIDGKRWYKTGDLIRMDAQGHMYFVDRTADMIKHKGYRISASEIEAAIKDHPAAISACVVGVPDKRVGERIKAFVVLKEDARGITGNELIRWCKSRLTSYKVPEYIEFRDMLPKSKVGKYLRRELRREERDRVSGS
ncbi:MAG: acyl--CoA ligase [Deltaproteobacteria bacterium]|nr:acyl--CoA ligase [Deltaproteobacteria bacterium]